MRKRCLRWEIKVIHILLSGTVMGKQAVPLIFLQSKFMFTNFGARCKWEVCEGLAMRFSPYGYPYVFLLCLRTFSLWHAHMPVFLQLNNIKTNPIYAPFGWVDWVINSWESLLWEAGVLLCEQGRQNRLSCQVNAGSQHPCGADVADWWPWPWFQGGESDPGTLGMWAHNALSLLLGGIPQ